MMKILLKRLAKNIILISFQRNTLNIYRTERIAVKAPYHSALKDDLKIEGELDYYESNGSVVLCYDLTTGIHPSFRSADVIYSEPSWKDGYEKFQDRAGSLSDKSYYGFLAYIDSIKKVIEELKIPAYIIMGKHMQKRLNPDHVMDIMLHSYKSVLGVWNAELPEVKTNQDVLKFISEKYFCALDFSCGYGNTAVAMLGQGKQFICSDINKKCVYYIATEIMGRKSQLPTNKFMGL